MLPPGALGHCSEEIVWDRATDAETNRRESLRYLHIETLREDKDSFQRKGAIADRGPYRKFRLFLEDDFQDILSERRPECTFSVFGK